MATSRFSCSRGECRESLEIINARYSENDTVEILKCPSCRAEYAHIDRLTTIAGAGDPGMTPTQAAVRKRQERKRKRDGL